MVHRRDPETYVSKRNAANRARHRATKRLIAAHRAEFDRVYGEEAAREGVVPTGPRGPHLRLEKASA